MQKHPKKQTLKICAIVFIAVIFICVLTAVAVYLLLTPPPVDHQAAQLQVNNIFGREMTVYTEFTETAPNGYNEYDLILGDHQDYKYILDNSYNNDLNTIKPTFWLSGQQVFLTVEGGWGPKLFLIDTDKAVHPMYLDLDVENTALVCGYPRIANDVYYYKSVHELEDCGFLLFLDPEQSLPLNKNVSGDGLKNSASN